jgi:hypothetical protein
MDMSEDSGSDSEGLPPLEPSATCADPVRYLDWGWDEGDRACHGREEPRVLAEVSLPVAETQQPNVAYHNPTETLVVVTGSHVDTCAMTVYNGFAPGKTAARGFRGLLKGCLPARSDLDACSGIDDGGLQFMRVHGIAFCAWAGCVRGAVAAPDSADVTPAGSSAEHGSLVDAPASDHVSLVLLIDTTLVVFNMDAAVRGSGRPVWVKSVNTQAFAKVSAACGGTFFAYGLAISSEPGVMALWTKDNLAPGVPQMHRVLVLRFPGATLLTEPSVVHKCIACAFATYGSFSAVHFQGAALYVNTDVDAYRCTCPANPKVHVLWDLSKAKLCAAHISACGAPGLISCACLSFEAPSHRVRYMYGCSEK